MRPSPRLRVTFFTSDTSSSTSGISSIQSQMFRLICWEAEPVTVEYQTVDGAVVGFTELRFEKAREETGAQLCVSCHREHSAVRVTTPDAGYCVSCHSDLKVKDDKTSPTHDFLVQNKRWESCLQCHDYHGNHRWRTPLRLVDAPTVDAIGQYLKDGPSPYGSTIVKAREELSP